MGDARHKASPPDYPEEPVTDDFVDAVLAMLEANRTQNRLHKRKRGDPGYLISNRSELAQKATNDDQTLLSKIIGPAKPSTKIKRIGTSRYVGAIRDALGIPAPETATLDVPADRVDVLRFLAELRDEEFAIFESVVVEKRKKADRTPKSK